MKYLARLVQNCRPNSLFARLLLAWIFALLVGHIFSAATAYFQSSEHDVERTHYYLVKDLGILLPVLESATPAQRADWIKKMERSSYFYELGSKSDTSRVVGFSQFGFSTIDQHGFDQDLRREIGAQYAPVELARKAPEEIAVLRLLLADGTPLIIHVKKPRLKLGVWNGLSLTLQVLIVIAFTWLTVRQAVRPLLRLAAAAQALGQSLQCEPLTEDGPSEVAKAAAAFNAMRQRISDHLAERVHILAAISHDLQTPITRMRLRTDLMDDTVLRDKLQNDLGAMQTLVAEGIAYAKSPQSALEATCRTDVDAMLDSLVCDYVDDGHRLELSGEIGQVIVTRPHTLRRIVINLLDNALKFADQVSISVTPLEQGRFSITVSDRGPGIAEHELDAVLQPFYRVEGSRNRDTGGTGLGLAIAQQLCLSLDGTLTLRNRDGGGLEAKIDVSVAVSAP